MKIVAMDNFDRDYISEKVVACDLTAKQAKEICDRLNKESGLHGDWFYQVRLDDAPIYTARY